MSKLLFILFFCLSFNVITAQKINVKYGVVEIYENFASKNVQPRNVGVWLPQHYSPKKKYAVLYMHDGQMLFDSTITFNQSEWGVDECLTQLIREGKIKNTIVVGIWNTKENRHQEYFPQKPYQSLSKDEKEKVGQSLEKIGMSKEFKPTSDNYLKFIVEELKPFIDNTYSTFQNKENTFIAGSSMGGLISMYAVCEYPDVFGGAACISTHWPGTFEVENNPIPESFYTYLKEKLPNPKSIKIYFDYGTVDLDALYPPLQAKVDEIMQSKGFTNENWITKKFEGENHSENAWKKRLHIPMEFLLKK
ncbi:MAG TPA: alpha/beta hydrolase-fold protein [Flavobacterium sp.]|uniref:alpha/beta hydrolase n=1 Tax=unclassified Flavobacterium TaxID=196869 RepID=UPI000E8008AE|nr:MULTISPECIES: alpha/beta hydrolase-fold protein [unclassified Flavobacterium]HBI00522.1 esterase [Flavobacterium sp.]HRE77256.1 alpha/beta hydrolase-fold protein [Flavobacterium sp.]